MRLAERLQLSEWYPALARALGDVASTEADEPIARWVMREKARIAIREFEGESIRTTAAAMSDLAERSVRAALRAATARFAPSAAEADGMPRGFVFLGMGKLSGGELNPSSDVDLVALYDAEQLDPTGESSLGVATKLVRETVRLLEENTPYGQAWRIDLRLRPEGARGALAHSTLAAQRYLEVFGRTWERAAYLRARAIAGDLSLGAQFLSDIEPWVWRRVVDPRVGREVARMVVRSRRELGVDPATNLKLGIGGIREIEFFVQGLQLVWGCRHPSLRRIHTLDALTALRQGGWVTDAEETSLRRAWEVLRRFEHDTQFRTLRQTHDVPPKERWAHLAHTLGSPSAEALQTETARLRAEVHEAFLGLLPGEDAGGARAYDGVRAWMRDGDVSGLSDALARSGYADAEVLADALVALARRPTDPFGQTTEQTHEGFVEALFDDILAAADPASCASTLARVLRTWRDPTWLTGALVSAPEGRARLLRAAGTGSFLADILAARPERIVQVLRAEPIEIPLSSDELDDDASLGQDRRYKSQSMLAVGAPHARGELSLGQVTSRLSAVAEQGIEHAFRRAQRRGGHARWGVFAVGKLAGRELGYTSDLDLLFVFDDDDEYTDAYARQVQRVLRDLSAGHPEGRGYELDMRMRPSGSQGPLVTSLNAFRAYYTGRSGGDRAAAWQIQALLRTRGIAGEPDILASVDQIRANALLAVTDAELQGIAKLRARRIHEAEGRLRCEGMIDIKQGCGGLADYEHGVQRAQLMHQVHGVSFEDGVRGLQNAGHWSASVAQGVLSDYQALRMVELGMQLVTGRAEHHIKPQARTNLVLRRFLLDQGADYAHREQSFFDHLHVLMQRQLPILWST